MKDKPFGQKTPETGGKSDKKSVSVREFNHKWGHVIDAINRNEPVHPEHIDAYTTERKNVDITSQTHPSDIPPEVSATVKLKSATKFGTQPPKQSVAYYSKVKKPRNMPERTLVYGRDGTITEQVHPNAPDFRGKNPIKPSKTTEITNKSAAWQVAGEVPPKRELSKEEECCKAVDWFSKSEKKEKPFHGYNPERHSRTGGLSDKARKKMNRESGSNLQRPVTEKNPSGKRAARRRSFCARMSGVKGPTSKEGKLTPKGAALKRWRCSKSLQEKFMKSMEDLQKRCWEGYEPVPGKKAYSKGSCVKKTENSLEKGPYLRQGSKLGQALYDDVQNIERKRTRTGEEAVGAGIRAEQLWGGKAGYRTAKEQAKEMSMKDKMASKKNPIKTLKDLTPEEIKALNEKLNRSEDERTLPAMLRKARSMVSCFKKSKMWKNSDVESTKLEHPHDSGPAMALRFLQDIESSIEKLKSSVGEKDLPDWVDAKIAQAAQQMQEASSYMHFESENPEIEKSVLARSMKNKKVPTDDEKNYMHAEAIAYHNKARQEANDHYHETEDPKKKQRFSEVKQHHTALSIEHQRKLKENLRGKQEPQAGSIDHLKTEHFGKRIVSHPADVYIPGYQFYSPNKKVFGKSEENDEKTLYKELGRDKAEDAKRGFKEARYRKYKEQQSAQKKMDLESSPSKNPPPKNNLSIVKSLIKAYKESGKWQVAGEVPPKHLEKTKEEDKPKQKYALDIARAGSDKGIHRAPGGSFGGPGESWPGITTRRAHKMRQEGLSNKEQIEEYKTKLRVARGEHEQKLRELREARPLPLPKSMKEEDRKEDTPQPLSKPPVSEAQRRFMGAVAAGDIKSVPKSVGEKFLQEDPGGKLPEKIEKGYIEASKIGLGPVPKNLSPVHHKRLGVEYREMARQAWNRGEKNEAKKLMERSQLHLKNS